MANIKQKPKAEIAKRNEKESGWAVECFDGFYNFDWLKRIWWTFTGTESAPKTKKSELIMDLTEFLLFDSRESFDSFLSTLPDYLVQLIRLAAFKDFIDIKPLKKKLGLEITVEKKVSSWSQEIALAEKERLHCFVLAGKNNLILPEPFRTFFSRWLDPPPEAVPAPLTEPPELTWTNGEQRAETLQLALNNLPEFKRSWYRQDRVKGSFKKAELNAFRQKIGLEFLPLSGKKGPDPVGIIDQFIAAFNEEKPLRPKNMDDWTKDMLGRLFHSTTLTNPRPDQMDTCTGVNFEYFTFCPHLSCTSGNTLWYKYSRPVSRSAFKLILNEIAKTGGWYTIESLLDSLEARNIDRSLWLAREEPDLFCKASELVTSRVTVQADYDGRIRPSLTSTRDLIHLPLFRGYFYLMAILGIAEVAEKESTDYIMRYGADRPISIFDTIYAVRITPFGRWCLGLEKEKPAAEKTSFEAIADRDLLLVTFRGKSLARKLYLEQIGEPLGEERFRITEASFIRGCSTSVDMEDRIRQFTNLIDKEPSAKWLAFFETLRRRGRFFSHTEASILIDLGENAADFKEIFARDSKLAACIYRAEGNRIAVPASKQSRFMKLLAEHGFLIPHR